MTVLLYTTLSTTALLTLAYGIGTLLRTGRKARELDQAKSRLAKEYVDNITLLNQLTAQYCFSNDLEKREDLKEVMLNICRNNDNIVFNMERLGNIT